MRAVDKTRDAGRARSLAAALAFLFGSVAFYADHMAAARITQSPSDSGGPALAVADPRAAAPARPEAKTTIAWTKPWGNKS